MLCGPGRVCRCVVEERLGRSPESSHPPGPAYPGHRQARGSGPHQPGGFWHLMSGLLIIMQKPFYGDFRNVFLYSLSHLNQF